MNISDKGISDSGENRGLRLLVVTLKLQELKAIRNSERCPFNEHKQEKEQVKLEEVYMEMLF